MLGSSCENTTYEPRGKFRERFLDDVAGFDSILDYRICEFLEFGYIVLSNKGCELVITVILFTLTISAIR
jgi:hypothetical protein